jgi:hypothetical protein
MSWLDATWLTSVLLTDCYKVHQHSPHFRRFRVDYHVIATLPTLSLHYLRFTTPSDYTNQHKPTLSYTSGTLFFWNFA